MTASSSYLNEGNERWAVLSLEALGDGLGDAAIAAALESNRQEGEKSQSAIERNISKVNQTLSYLNDLANEFNDPPKMGRNFCGLRYGLYGVEGSSRRLARVLVISQPGMNEFRNASSFKETAIPEGY